MEKGRKLSEEHRAKLKIARQRIPSRNKGKHWKLSEETKKRMRGRLGVKSPNWKGGISKDKEKMSKKVKKWKEKNMDRVLYLNSRDRAKRKNAKGSHTFIEWGFLKAQYNYTCPCCGKKEPEITLTEDHIIPLDKGGSDYINNIQPLCRSCNCKKYITIIFFEPILWRRLNSTEEK